MTRGYSMASAFITSLPFGLIVQLPVSWLAQVQPLGRALMGQSLNPQWGEAVVVQGAPYRQRFQGPISSQAQVAQVEGRIQAAILAVKAQLAERPTGTTREIPL